MRVGAAWGFANKVRVNQGFEVGTAALNCIGLMRD